MKKIYTATVLAIMFFSRAHAGWPDSVLAAMTPAQKAGQMIIVYHSPLPFLRQHAVGGVLVVQRMLRKPEELKKELHTAERELPVPLLVCVDQEGGEINRLKYVARFKDLPSARSMARLPADSISALSVSVGRYLRDKGVNMVFAPCLDPATNEQGNKTFIDRMARSFGDTASQVVDKAGAFISGMERAGCMTVLKHFPGYNVEKNSDLSVAVSHAPAQAVFRLMTPFGLLKDRADAVMMSNIIYESVDTLPAVLSASFVNAARKTCGERALIVTDDLWAVSIRTAVAPPGTDIDELDEKDFRRVVRHAVSAGNDMLLITYPQKVPVMVDEITQLMRNDPALRARVDAAVRRVLACKQRALLRVTAPYSGS